MSRKNTIADFWTKVDKTATCWNWLSTCRGRMQYGVFSYRGQDYSAHRFSYALCNGPIGSGLQVLHKCDNPKCVNPQHLFLGTNRDNVNDKLAKGRGGAYDKSAKGEAAGPSILTEVQVIEIRSKYKSGEHTQVALAKHYGVHQSVLSRVIHYKTWKHIP